MESNQGIKSWQWIITVIIVVILIILSYYTFNGKAEDVSLDGNATSTEEVSVQGDNEINRIVVVDQYPGNVAYISSVQLENPGFVVVHKSKNGNIGDVIGSTYFEKGINTGKVTLSENTVEGETYYVVLHKDNGNKKFEATKDVTLKDIKGNDVMKTFKATSDITEIKG